MSEINHNNYACYSNFLTVNCRKQRKDAVLNLTTTTAYMKAKAVLKCLQNFKINIEFTPTAREPGGFMEKPQISIPQQFFDKNS